MIKIVRRASRKVERWQSGDMCLRWTATGMLEPQQQFRKIIGYSDIAKLAVAVERDLATRRAPLHTPTDTEANTLATISGSSPRRDRELPRLAGTTSPPGFRLS